MWGFYPVSVKLFTCVMWACVILVIEMIEELLYCSLHLENLKCLISITIFFWPLLYLKVTLQCNNTLV